MIKCQQPTWAQNWLSENILNTIYSTEFSENRDSSTTDSRYIVSTHTQYHMWQPENYNIGQTTCNILTQQVTHGIPRGHEDMSPWRRLLRLSSQHPISERSHCNSFDDRASVDLNIRHPRFHWWAPDLQMSCRDMTTWQGTRTVL